MSGTASAMYGEFNRTSAVLREYIHEVKRTTNDVEIQMKCNCAIDAIEEAREQIFYLKRKLCGEDNNDSNSD